MIESQRKSHQYVLESEEGNNLKNSITQQKWKKFLIVINSYI